MKLRTKASKLAKTYIDVATECLGRLVIMRLREPPILPGLHSQTQAEGYRIPGYRHTASHVGC